MTFGIGESALASIAAATAASAAGAGVAALLAPKPQDLLKPPAPPTVNDAVKNVEDTARLARRRGAGATLVSQPTNTGAAVKKTILGM